VPVDSCQLEDKIADEIIVFLRKLLPSFKLTAYNPHTRKGFLRHVLVKRGFSTNEIMVVLVTGSPMFPNKNAFIKELLKKFPQITTVIQSINSGPTGLVLGKQEKVLYGKGYITDILCGMRFRISAQSFYQINPVQTEILYRKAIEGAHLTEKSTLLDAYCGVGTIGLAASPYCGFVTGVELNPEAVRDARINVKENNVKNARFVCGDAGDFMEELADEGGNVDVVMMDPPRAGSSKKFIESLCRLAPPRVVYVSCNPETLARDLKYLTDGGYIVESIQPVDMFPHTEHVETVVMLSHKKPDSVINVKVEFGEGEGKVPLDNIAKRAEAYKPKERVTYKMIKEYIEAKYGFKVHTAYIAEVKRALGLPMYDAPNAVEELKQPRKHPTAEKVETIKDALKHFEVI
jgi:23S rRNA (uracil1939-C5)-methyltransferase